MKIVKIIMATLAASCVLYGCDREANQLAGTTVPTAEEAHITSRTFGEYELHFNAISTDQLQPDVARVYNIARSKNRAMLTVSILKSTGDLSGKPVAGTVNGSAVNLTGQIKDLTLRQIQEGDAIYYIGDIAVANGETLVFDIEATPENEMKKMSLRFSRQFFAD
jgi:hypothetical protein